MAYPGFQRGGCLRSGPIQKVGGGALQVLYTKSGGGGHSASGPIPLGTLKISTCTYLRATSHARTNGRKIHAGKG